MVSISARRTLLGLQLGCAALFTVPHIVQADSEILIIRHGEKPAQGLGQLNCKGFNRALALPKVIVGRYGKPDAIVAPNPGVQKADKGVPYSYIRPLATVEPLAISLEMPVEATLAFNDLMGLEQRFESAFANPKSQKVVIAWEHKIAEQVVRNFLQHRGVKTRVPHWEDQDFDSIYIISQSDQKAISFRVEKENIENLSERCQF